MTRSVSRTSTRELPLALVNLEDGLDSGEKLHLLSSIMEPCRGIRPAIIAVNEARWRMPRGRPEREAAALLSQLCDARYEISVGQIERSDHPPALLWDTQRLDLVEYSTASTDRSLWKRNTWTLAVLDSPNDAVRVIVPHWDYASGTRRLMEAETLASHVGGSLPVVVAGDLNSTASGPHLPHRDYTRVPVHKRRQKGRLTAVGWVDDTRALDTLIGPWDTTTNTRHHQDGAGLYALAEHDWQQRNRQGVLASTTHIEQSLLIDWILATRDVGLVPGTYRVWEGDPAWTDHKLITATITLPPRVR